MPRYARILGPFLNLFLWIWAALPVEAANGCVPTASVLCLHDLRFEARVTVQTDQGDIPGQAVPLTGSAGAFWFFSSDNLDLTIKVLNATAVDGHFWVFYGGLSDREFKIEIKDTTTGISKIYLNPQGKFVSSSDFTAFPLLDTESSSISQPAHSSRTGVKVDALVADFTFEILENRKVKFYDTSRGNPNRWCWTFGDSSGECDKDVPDPEHTFPLPGRYQVLLLVGRTEGPALTVSEVSKEVVIPSPEAPCSFELEPSSRLIGPEGGDGTVVVKTSAPNCSWAAKSNARFLKILSVATGPEDGQVKYRVEANDSSLPRTGTLTIAGETFTVEQAGASCDYDINPDSKTFPRTGGPGKVSVEAPVGCSWRVENNNPDFITVTSTTGDAGGREGAIEYLVAENPENTLREGSLTIAGKVFTVVQEPEPCVYAISPSDAEFTGGRGEGTVSVEAPPGCPWTAESPVDFVTIDPETQSGSGDGPVRYTVGPNPGTTSRQGTLLIAGQSFTITQKGCASFDPPFASFDAPGGDDTVLVSAPDNCSWEAGSNSPFLAITAGVSGMGGGEISYFVEANSGSLDREGTLSIGDTEFRVFQSGCTTQVILEPESFSAEGGDGTVTVTAPVDCRWIAESNVNFIKITSGATGSGNGIVEFSVGSTELRREGTMSIAGKTLTVEQEGPDVNPACIQTGSGPETAAFGPFGGISQLNVKAENGCSWKVGTDATFLKVNTSSASGNGNGKVPFCVAANRNAKRSGRLAVSEPASPSKVSFFPVTQKALEGGDPAVPCPGADPTALCLLEGRFEVRVAFGDSGVGKAESVTKSTGYFWFFDPANPELMVKVLDGTPVNDHFWIFIGALTDLPYVVTVIDTLNPGTAFYCNLNGTFQSFADVEALPRD